MGSMPWIRNISIYKRLESFILAVVRKSIESWFNYWNNLVNYMQFSTMWVVFNCKTATLLIHKRICLQFEKGEKRSCIWKCIASIENQPTLFKCFIHTHPRHFRNITPQVQIPSRNAIWSHASDAHVPIHFAPRIKIPNWFELLKFYNVKSTLPCQTAHTHTHTPHHNIIIPISRKDLRIVAGW